MCIIGCGRRSFQKTEKIFNDGERHTLQSMKKKGVKTGIPLHTTQSTEKSLEYGREQARHVHCVAAKGAIESRNGAKGSYKERPSKRVGRN
jgi:hypothetical protein